MHLRRNTIYHMLVLKYYTLMEKQALDSLHIFDGLG